MNPSRTPLFLAALGLALASLLGAASARGQEVHGLDAAVLAEVRERVHRGDAALLPAYRQLLAEADEALAHRFASVMDKAEPAPSGDWHDYYSLAPYWWPNPATPDGLPYVRRDGERNPEARQLDDQALSAVLDAVPTLAWAWYFSGDDRYAAKAGDVLRLWFLDPATRMNPNLRHAQAVRGRNTGRMYGIIETSGLYDGVDALAVLKESDALTESEWEAMDGWLGDFLTWLRTSEFGQAEASRLNNHATAYDAQVAAIALYLGQDRLAHDVLAAVPARRIDPQVEPDGRQPEELARTKSFGYSVYNLRHAFHAAALAPHVGVDLFGYVSDDGGSLRAALDYLVPVADGREHWGHPQLAGTWQGAEAGLAALLREAALAYDDPRYEAVRQRLDADASARYHLLHPAL